MNEKQKDTIYGSMADRFIGHDWGDPLADSIRKADAQERWGDVLQDAGQHTYSATLTMAERHRQRMREMAAHDQAALYAAAAGLGSGLGGSAGSSRPNPWAIPPQYHGGIGNPRPPFNLPPPTSSPP